MNDSVRDAARGIAFGIWITTVLAGLACFFVFGSAVTYVAGRWCAQLLGWY